MRTVTALVYSLLAILPACSPERSTSQSQDEARSSQSHAIARESSVINAAALAFFAKNTKLERFWSEGDFVVLEPQWDGQDDRTFGDLVGVMLEGSDFQLMEVPKEDRPLVKRVVETSGSALAPAVAFRSKLAELNLDDRILLESEGDEFRDYTSKKERTGKGRAIGSATRPVFSANARYAFVRFHLKWSIHGGPAVMILESKQDRWEVIYLNCTVWP